MTGRVDSRVRERREARGLAQVALPERAKLTRQSVGAIEAGRAMPAADVALRTARALECGRDLKSHGSLASSAGDRAAKVEAA